MFTITQTRRAVFAALFAFNAPFAFADGGGLQEATDLQALGSKESGRASYTPANGVKFKASDNVFLKSALAVDFTYGKATVKLPLFRGLSPTGESVYYIVTEASDFEVAKKLGINFAPKMKHAAGTPGEQRVTMEQGLIRFKGNVDFSPKYELVAGSPYPFPPKVAKPGAIADAEWSSMVVMPSGLVLNVQMVHNASGNHDRLKAIDLKKRTVTLSLLDGFQDGKQYYYHLVTDVSADVPAVIEQGVFAPRLGLIPEFGKSEPSDKSALLGFSPVANGITDTKTGQHQGFGASIANGGIDPINIFPIDPNNDDSSDANNYSPLWDAHVVAWTDDAIKNKKVKRITSFAELKTAVDAGLVTSASMDGSANAYVAGVRPLKVVINCPVIAQPVLASR